MRTLFNASEIDGRLSPQRALGRALLRASADTTFDPVTAGQLTEEEAWRRLLHVAWGMPEPIWSLDSWMLWSMRHPAYVRRMLGDDDLVARVRARHDRMLGDAGVMLIDLLLHTPRRRPARPRHHGRGVGPARRAGRPTHEHLA